MVQLSYITQNAEIPANVEPDAYEFLQKVRDTANEFKWEKVHDYMSYGQTRRMDELAAGFDRILNAFTQEVQYYRTDIIHDIMQIAWIIGSLKLVDLEHELPIFILGLRKYGTDNHVFVASRINNEFAGLDEYTSIFLLTLRDTDYDETVLTTYICKGRR